MGTAADEGFELLQGAGRALRRERRRDRAAGVVSDARRLRSTSCTSDPTSTRRCWSSCSTGWIDAGLGAAAAAQALVADLPTRHRRDVRRRQAARLPRPPPDHAPARRREHRRSPGRASSCTPATDHAGPRRAAAPRRTSPTIAVAAVRRRRSSTSPSSSAPRWSSASAPTRRRARTPGRPPVDHRRPRPSWPSGSASSAARSTCPPASQAAIERRCARDRAARVGLWAQVPHYVAAMPYPPASIALLDGLGQAAGLSLRATRCEAASRARAASTSWSRRTTSTARCCDQLEPKPTPRPRRDAANAALAPINPS